MELQQPYQPILKAFSQRVRAELDGDIEALVVYGSVARGEASPESDIDILVISSHKDTIRHSVSRIRSTLDLKYGTMTTLTYRTPEEFEYGAEHGNPFIKQVLAEGVVLCDNGTYRRIREKVFGQSRAIPR